MNNHHDLTDIERQLSREADRLREREINNVDIDNLAARAAARRTRSRILRLAAILLIGSGAVFAVRSWMSPAAAPIVAEKEIAGPVGPAAVAKAAPSGDNAEISHKPLRLLITTREGDRHRVIGLIDVVPGEHAAGGGDKGYLRVVDRQRRVKLNELPPTQQAAVRRLFNLPEAAATETTL